MGTHQEAPDPVEDEVDVSMLRRWSIDQVTRIKEQRTAEVIDGTLCDIQTAGLAVKVFDVLSSENQESAQRLPFGRFGAWCWSQTRSTSA